MSFFLSLFNRLNVDEDKLNNLVNASFLGSLINLATRFSGFVSSKISNSSLIFSNLDNIYFAFLVILLFVIPFGNTTLLGVFALFLIFLNIINSIVHHKKFELSSIHLPVMCYLAVILLSVAFSSLFLPSLKGFAKMFIYIASFFSFFSFFKRNPQKIFPCVLVVAITSSIELLFALKQMLFGVNALAGWQDVNRVNPELLMNRIFGTLKPYNPNLFAAYILATMPCIFAVAKSKLKWSFLLFAPFALLALLALVQSGCRGAYIGLFFGTCMGLSLVYSVFGRHIKAKITRKKLIFAVLILLLAVIFIITSPSIMHRLESIFTLRGDSSNSYRVNVYISSIKMFLDNFWIGIGPGNTTYRLIYGLYMITGFDALGAYNIFLEMAVESGIFAPLIFLWMVILTFFKSLKKLFLISVKYKLVIIALLSAIFAMLMHGFFDTIWYRPQIQLIFWLYLAILAVITMKGFSYEQK